MLKNVNILAANIKFPTPLLYNIPPPHFQTPLLTLGGDAANPMNLAAK